MFRINILVIFVVAINAAPSPYYSLIESPTSRFEQHYFTSPQHQQQPLKVHLQEQIFPASTRSEYPDQHVGYFYHNVKHNNVQNGFGHHQLRQESWQQPQPQIQVESFQKQEVKRVEVESSEQSGEMLSAEENFGKDINQKSFEMKNGEQNFEMKSGEQNVGMKSGEQNVELNNGEQFLKPKSDQQNFQKVFEVRNSQENSKFESGEQTLKQNENEQNLRLQYNQQNFQQNFEVKNGAQDFNMKGEEQNFEVRNAEQNLEVKNGEQKFELNENEQNLRPNQHQQNFQQNFEVKNGAQDFDMRREEQTFEVKNDEQKFELNKNEQNLRSNQDQQNFQQNFEVKNGEQNFEVKNGDVQLFDVRFDEGSNDEKQQYVENSNDKTTNSKNQGKDFETSTELNFDFQNLSTTTLKTVEPKAKLETSSKSSPKDDADSVEIRADSSVNGLRIPEEKMFMENENQAFYNQHLTQPLLHRLYTFNNQFYVATAPEFYGYFHPVHNPMAPIFSLQELHAVVRDNNNIEAKNAKAQTIAALPMPSPTSRTSRGNQLEADSLNMQFSPLAASPFKIHVEDDIEQDKSESTQINARSKSPSFNRSAREVVKMSRKEDKREESLVEGRDLSDDSSVAQAKPSGTAIAGDGGVASSKPVATAVSGLKGLSVASPSATAIAGNFDFEDDDRKMKNKTQRPSATVQQFRKTIDPKDFV